MSRNTSISIGNYFDNFIQNRISAGRFKNASEVVRAGLRLLEEEETRIIALREAIQEGIESGIAYDFNPESHLERLKAKKKLNGSV
ncbi:MAG: type II toxin-antitoxin system ParD family antitoxin [Bacteroidia bacterium]|jgi:antitoxin ParD1/3/4|nr:type II toxin-antitoxin system ParD family antitoxin [Bacteroidia bacterium]